MPHPLGSERLQMNFKLSIGSGNRSYS